VAVEEMNNVGIVVDDMQQAIAFFTELGLELEGEADIQGSWADRAVGLDGIHCHIAMMRTPDGHGRLELAQYHSPAVQDFTPKNPPHNILGMHRVMYKVDDLDDTIARLDRLGGELIGQVSEYRDQVRLCYYRGPAGIIIGLSEYR
jgi:catechol 2,3-dioxygenase-like lactoylglutathione lyase family enzyme